MKRAKGGVVSSDQLAMHAALRACGRQILVCHGSQEALEALRSLGNLPAALATPPGASCVVAVEIGSRFARLGAAQQNTYENEASQ